MTNSFVKMHGSGNDFILIQPAFFGFSNLRTHANTFSQQEVPVIVPIVQKLCQFHFGVGADGVLIISEVQKATYKMSVFNRDGSFAKMCGNGLRCAAAYIYQRKKQQQKFVMLTDGGEKEVSVSKRGKHEFWVSTVLGSPSTPKLKENKQWAEHADFQKYIGNTPVYEVAINNKHLVTFLTQQRFEQLTKKNAHEQLALTLRSNQPYNVNFCTIDEHKSMKIITYELGAGLTFACGTGSAASTFAGYSLHLLNQQTLVQTRGGSLVISCLKSKEDEYVMRVDGPANYVFTGVIDE